MNTELMKCPECARPSILYEWMSAEDAAPNSQIFQGPTTHPHIKDWCDGECAEDQFGGGWNHRLIEYPKMGDFIDMGIHEVFYTKDKKPSYLTMHPVGIVGSSIEEMKEVLAQYAKALDQPILKWDDFPRSEPEKSLKYSDE